MTQPDGRDGSDATGPEDAPSEALRAREESGLLRRRLTVRQVDATHVEVDGRVLLNFAGNDYLGLSRHAAVVAALRGAAAVGSTASPLICGHSPSHAAAEAALAEWKGTDSAVLAPSGYQANVAAVQAAHAVCERRGRPLLILDKLVHASLVDAARSVAADMRVFPHNHLGKLARLLAACPAQRRPIVITESIFSMDGDAADLRGLAELRRRRPFVLLLDEAHASGVYGASGRGLAHEAGVPHIADLTVVTLSKALGCAGAAVLGSRAWVDAVVNFGRALIYSTAMPPALADAARIAVGLACAEPERAARVRALARRLRARLGRSDPLPDSPIVPVIVGDAGRAVAWVSRLRDAGIFVVAVRPPTVPAGQSRLRISLSAEHTEQEVDRLAASIAALSREG